jgi:hypothetical protein
MTRLTLSSSLALVAFALVAFALVASSCGAGDPAGSFTISLSDQALTLGQGVQDTVTITVARSRYSKPVALTLVGVPTGVSAMLTPSTLQSPSQTSLLVLSTSGTATLGAATITLQAKGDGVADQTATFNLTIGVTGNFSLGSQGSPAIAAQGGGASATILVTRSGGHADNVALAVTGPPSGVVAVIAPTSTNGGTASLSITVAANTTVGTYPLTITGVAPGLANQTTFVNLNVIAPPSTAMLAMPFCAGSVPSWFAYQNEGFAWQTLSPVASAFTFSATAKIAVAYTFVRQTAQVNETDLNVIYADRSELAAQSDRDCDGAKTAGGSVVGATTGQSVRVAMGATVANATAAAPTFTLSSLYDRVLDLVATKGIITTSPNNIQIAPDMVLVRRAQNPANNTTLSPLDFGSAEAFVPVGNTVTIGNGIPGDIFNVANTFWTGTNTYGAISASQPTVFNSAVYSVPSAKMVAGDLHELLVEANQPNFFSGRVNVAYLGALADRTEALSPALSSPSVSTLTYTPYLRLRGQLPVQAEYPSAARFIYFQDGGAATDRLLFIVLTKGFLGATPSSTWDVVTPDFGTIFGFNPTWMPSTSSVLYEADAFAGSGALLFGAVPIVGDVVKQAYRVQANNTLLRANAGALHARAQYLRR